MSDRATIIEALLAVAREARFVANGDTTAMPALLVALSRLDQARADVKDAQYV